MANKDMLLLPEPAAKDSGKYEYKGGVFTIKELALANFHSLKILSLKKHICHSITMSSTTSNVAIRGWD